MKLTTAEFDHLARIAHRAAMADHVQGRFEHLTRQVEVAEVAIGQYQAEVNNLAAENAHLQAENIGLKDELRIRTFQLKEANGVNGEA